MNNFCIVLISDKFSMHLWVNCSATLNAYVCGMMGNSVFLVDFSEHCTVAQYHALLQKAVNSDVAYKEMISFTRLLQ